MGATHQDPLPATLTPLLCQVAESPLHCQHQHLIARLKLRRSALQQAEAAVALDELQELPAPALQTSLALLTDLPPLQIIDTPHLSGDRQTPHACKSNCSVGSGGFSVRELLQRTRRKGTRTHPVRQHDSCLHSHVLEADVRSGVRVHGSLKFCSSPKRGKIGIHDKVNSGKMPIRDPLYNCKPSCGSQSSIDSVYRAADRKHTCGSQLLPHAVQVLFEAPGSLLMCTT